MLTHFFRISFHMLRWVLDPSESTDIKFFENSDFCLVSWTLLGLNSLVSDIQIKSIQTTKPKSEFLNAKFKKNSSKFWTIPYLAYSHIRWEKSKHNQLVFERLMMGLNEFYILFSDIVGHYHHCFGLMWIWNFEKQFQHLVKSIIAEQRTDCRNIFQLDQTNELGKQLDLHFHWWSNIQWL